MKYTLIIAMVILFSTSAICQNDTGIFLTIKCGKKMPKQTVSLTLKSVCLASNPIIVSSELESVTEVKENSQRHMIYFDLGISKKAAQTLRQLAVNLPSSTFALVVDKEVFSVFPASDLTGNSMFRFEGQQKDLATFARVREKLRALKDGGIQ